MFRSGIVFLVAVVGFGLVNAQDAVRRDTVEPEVEGRSTEEAGAAEETRRVEVRERVRRAIALPRTADEARREGVPDETIDEVLRAGRERGVPASDMQEILEVETETVRAGGDRGNFGAAVLEMKANGLRGRDLADAIHAEQVARGMKKPKNRGHDADRERGREQRRHGDDDEYADDDHDDDDHHGDDDHDGDRGGKPKTKGKGKKGGAA